MTGRGDGRVRTPATAPRHHEISAGGAANWTGEGSRAARAVWRGDAAWRDGARVGDRAQASVHSNRASSGAAPSRSGRSDVPMPRDTYIGGPASRYHPAT